MPLGDKAPKKGKSRLTNGWLFGAHVNARSAPARRLRDLITGYSALFGGKPSLPQANMIRRLASFDMSLEKFEDDLAEGKPVNMTEYAALANASRRTLESLGLTAASAQPESPKAIPFDLATLRFVSVPARPDDTSPEPEVEAENA